MMDIIPKRLASMIVQESHSSLLVIWLQVFWILFAKGKIIVWKSIMITISFNKSARLLLSLKQIYDVFIKKNVNINYFILKWISLCNSSFSSSLSYSSSSSSVSFFLGFSNAKELMEIICWIVNLKLFTKPNPNSNKKFLNFTR